MHDLRAAYRHVFSSLLTVAVFIALSLPVYAATAKHKARLEATDPGTRKEIGPKAVSIVSDGKNVTFVFEAGEDVAKHLSGNMAGRFAKVMIDTDLNEKTGGKPFGVKKYGFDVQIEIDLCKEFKNGVVCGGDVKAEITGVHSSFDAATWDAADERFADNHKAFWKGGRGTIEANKVTVVVAYVEFKGKSGQKIRLLVMGGYSSGPVYDELMLELK